MIPEGKIRVNDRRRGEGGGGGGGGPYLSLPPINREEIQNLSKRGPTLA